MANQNYEIIDMVAVCKSHQISLMLMSSADCPTCDKKMNAPDFNRCADCAVNQNKCSYCDGPLS